MQDNTATAIALPTASGRQTRRRARTHARLLRAAQATFAAKGYRGTKIADIAAAADVGTGTFYLYFPTKDALFADLVKDTAARARDEMERAKAAHADPADKARVGTETFFRFAAANREVFRILFGHGTRFDSLLHEVHQLFIADIERDFALGVAAGVFAPLPARIVAQALVGMLSHVVSWWLEHEDVPIAEIIHTMHRLLNEGTVLKETVR